MAYGSTNYSAGYGTPQSQGPQGQQGTDQTAKPDSHYSPSRAPMWRPAPGSRPMTQGNTQPQTYSAQTAAPGSPVTANGQIAPASQPQSGQAVQPSSAQQPSGNTSQSQGPSPMVTGPPLTVPPSSPDPFQGRGVWTGQQWVPNDHPIAIEFLRGSSQTSPSSPGGAQPNPAQYSPFGPYPGRPAGTTYTPDQLPNYQFQGYNPISSPQAPPPQQFSQYQGQDFSQIQGQQNALLQNLLANPSLSDTVINQMRAKQRESALAMNQQFQQQAAQSAAARGTNLDSQLTNTQNDLNARTQEQILSGYRDLDIAAALQNRQDQMSALGMSEQVMTGQLGRGIDQYNTGLRGQQAQADEFNRSFGNNMAAAGFNQDENRFGYQSQFDPAEFGLRQSMAQAGLNQAGAASQHDAYRTDLGAFFDWQNNLNQRNQINLQGELGRGGLDLDRQRLAQQESQFGRGLQLDWAQFLNNMRMGNYNYGLDVAQLQQLAQNQMMGQMGF